jgi:hypothetical protein
MIHAIRTKNLALLPPPPQKMLEAAQKEEDDYIRILAERIMTIPEVRKVLLPIIMFITSSPVNKIFKFELNRYYDWRLKNDYLHDTSYKADFHLPEFNGSCCEFMEYSRYHYQSACDKMVKAQRKKTKEQLEDFVRTKTGKVMKTRINRALYFTKNRSYKLFDDHETTQGRDTEDQRVYVYRARGGFWSRLEEFKKGGFQNPGFLNSIPGSLKGYIYTAPQ